MIGGLQGENGDLNNKYLKKNLKESVANIWKHSGGFRRHARWLRNFPSWKSPFCSQRLISQRAPCDFTASTLWFRSQRLISQLRNWPSAWYNWLPMVITPSFQLQFVHCLKNWITDFPSFETTYSMHKLSSKKCSKSGCTFECFMVDFSLCFPSFHLWFAYGKGL